VNSSYCIIEANYWQTRSIARPLCDSRATCMTWRSKKESIFRPCTVRSFLLNDPTDDLNSLRLTTTGYFRSRDKPEKGVKRTIIDDSRCVFVSHSTGCDVTVTATKCECGRMSRLSPRKRAGCWV